MSLEDVSERETTSSLVTGRQESERDEVKEIQRLSQVETASIRFLRVLMAFGLLMTTAAVSGATYFFLWNQENSNFQGAVSQC